MFVGPRFLAITIGRVVADGQDRRLPKKVIRATGALSLSDLSYDPQHHRRAPPACTHTLPRLFNLRPPLLSGEGRHSLLCLLFHWQVPPSFRSFLLFILMLMITQA
jgi:hypothetical protein